MVRTSDKSNDPKRATLQVILISPEGSESQRSHLFVSTEHPSSDSDQVSTPAKRKAFHASKRLSFNCLVGQHGVNQYHNKFSCHGVSWETSYISWPTIHGIVFDNLALLDDVFFVRFGVMFNV